MIILNIAALTGCAWVQQKFLRLHGTILRLVLIYGSVVVMGLRLVVIMNSSQWAIDIRSGNIATSPFNPPLLPDRATEFSDAYIQSLACPTMDDIMMGSRSEGDSNMLPGSHFLDYHHGTKRWKIITKAYIPIFVSCRIDSVFEASTIERSHRFLEQNVYGDWIELTEEESKQRTIKLLWETLSSPNLTPCTKLGTTPSYLISHSLVTIEFLSQRMVQLLMGRHVHHAPALKQNSS